MEDSVKPPKSNEISIIGLQGYETYISGPNEISVRPKWIKVTDRLPKSKKVLAIYVSDKNAMYNMRHDGWFRDTIYSCRIQDEKFIIESHGPILPATHWAELPPPPKEE